MSKGEKLIWELFVFVRELMPPTAENTARQNEWSRIFHELEVGSAQAANPAPVAEDAGLGDAGDDDESPADDDEGNEHPVSHAARHAVGKRKKK
jgi:hypothetical protein